jgi:tripartite-type tricarboxylate transporter receptor subunit TctC
MMTWSAAVRALALGTALVAAPLGCRAHAETFPNRPVRLLVGFAAGGGADTASRIFAARMTETWGQQVLVENRGGAGGILAAELTARAPPDGYTLLNCGISHVLRPLLYKKLSFDAQRDFAPIAPIATFANILVVNPASPFKTLGALLAYARANPGKLHYGSSGVGGSIHLTTELFKSMAGVDIVHVPYKGGAPAFADLVAGQIDVMFDNTTVQVGPVKAGQVRALGISSLQRYAALPDLPTIDEAGVPGFDVVGWYGVCAPAGVPAPILDKINADMNAALTTPEMRVRLAEQGIDPAPMTRPEYAGFLAAEAARWARVLKDAGVEPE